MISGGIAPGWYPDYEAPPGHQRYWDGQRWTERRSSEPVVEDATPGRTHTPWVVAAVAFLVVVSAAVLVIGQRETGPSSAKSPLSAGSAAPRSQDGSKTPRRTWEVAAAVDGSTIRLANGVDVRLVGIRDSCSAGVLARLVVGHPVTLTRRGPDKNAAGMLLRYVERDGVDVGMTLIQQGWANASGRANPRGAIYRRLDERSPDICG